MGERQGHYSCYLYEGKGIFVDVRMISLLYACTALVLWIGSGDGRAKLQST